MFSVHLIIRALLAPRYTLFLLQGPKGPSAPGVMQYFYSKGTKGPSEPANGWNPTKSRPIGRPFFYLYKKSLPIVKTIFCCLEISVKNNICVILNQKKYCMRNAWFKVRDCMRKLWFKVRNCMEKVWFRVPLREKCMVQSNIILNLQVQIESIKLGQNGFDV